MHQNAPKKYSYGEYEIKYILHIIMLNKNFKKYKKYTYIGIIFKRYFISTWHVKKFWESFKDFEIMYIVDKRITLYNKYILQ